MSFIGAAVRAYREHMIAHTRELVQIHSAASEPLPGKPSGEGVAQALEYVLALGQSLGFRTRLVDGYAGHIEYGHGDEIAAVLTHVDTVPLGEGWTYPPLEAEIVDGRLYGRGASDNKYAVIAAIYSLYALKEAGIVPRRRIRIIIGTREETGMTDMDYYFAREPLPTYGIVTDGPYPICNAEKGSLVLHISSELEERECWIEAGAGTAPNMVPDYARAALCTGSGEREAVEAFGSPGHGAFPQGGRNAIALLVGSLAARLPTWNAQAEEGLAANALLSFAIEKLGSELDGQSLGIAYDQEIHGQVTVNCAQLQSSRSEIRLVLDIRYPVGVDSEFILRTVGDSAGEYGLTVRVAQHMPALYIEPESELIRRLTRAYETATGEKASLISMAGGTYAKKLHGRAVTFGPSFPGAPPSRFHQADENIGIDELLRHAEVCTQALYELSQ